MLESPERLCCGEGQGGVVETEPCRVQSEEMKETWSGSVLGPGEDDIAVLECCVKGDGGIRMMLDWLSHEVFPQESEKCLAKAKGNSSRQRE